MAAAPRLLDKVQLTELRPEDISYLHDTWANAYRTADECEHIPARAFWPWHRAIRTQILERPGTMVVVARGRERPLWIAGYGVFERVGPTFVAHWLHARGGCKRQGVAGRLLATALGEIGDGASRLVMTHRTYITTKAESLGFVYERLTHLYGSKAA